jgi:hypothetical protein
MDFCHSEVWLAMLKQILEHYCGNVRCIHYLFVIHLQNFFLLGISMTKPTWYTVTPWLILSALGDR